MMALVFVIPKSNNNNLLFIRKLLESQDESGFLHKLYKKNWIIDFSGGSIWAEPTDSDLMQVKFMLTDLGMENSITIAKHFFHYINSLEDLIKNTDVEKFYN